MITYTQKNLMDYFEMSNTIKMHELAYNKQFNHDNTIERSSSLLQWDSKWEVLFPP